MPNFFLLNERLFSVVVFKIKHMITDIRLLFWKTFSSKNQLNAVKHMIM